MNGLQPEKFRGPRLVDFGIDAAGHGRRLETLGDVLVDRPLPQTVERRRHPARWEAAAAVYRPAGTAAANEPTGAWEFRGPVPAPWHAVVSTAAGALVLEVHPAPSGQVGVFLEQAAQWRWLEAATRPGMAILSLFAHSGAASLAAAAAGAEVVHVDASRQAIALARRNAAASGLEQRPISWICEDAATFVSRCLRRGRRFAGVVLDPPSWGHGPKGQAFSIDRHLDGMLADIARLLDPDTPGPLLLTCHSPGWHPARLRETLASACAAAHLPARGRIESGSLDLEDDSGRTLSLGGFARQSPSP
ncbi:MAG: class I SAM-dependent methyltransferase [Pirellulales bacterium]